MQQNKPKTDTSALEARNGKDIQGIPWERMNYTRDKYREKRLKQYKNYECLSRSRVELDKVRFLFHWNPLILSLSYGWGVLLFNVFVCLCEVCRFTCVWFDSTCRIICYPRFFIRVVFILRCSSWFSHYRDISKKFCNPSIRGCPVCSTLLDLELIRSQWTYTPWCVLMFGLVLLDLNYRSAFSSTTTSDLGLNIVFLSCHVPKLLCLGIFFVFLTWMQWNGVLWF